MKDLIFRTCRPLHGWVLGSGLEGLWFQGSGCASVPVQCLGQRALGLCVGVKIMLDPC